MLAPDLGIGRRMRKAGETAMIPFYLVGAIAAAGLLLYLVVALLNAEEL